MTEKLARIRIARTADADTLVAVHLAARDTYYRGVLPDADLDDPAEHAALHEAYGRVVVDPARVVLCAETGGAVVGFVSLGPPIEPVEDGDPAAVGQLVGLYVLPASWGRRIGSTLHEACVRSWQARAITTGRLEVWADNTRARAFYTRRGWRADGFQRPGPGDSAFVRLRLAVPAA